MLQKKNLWNLSGVTQLRLISHLCCMSNLGYQRVESNSHGHSGTHSDEVLPSGMLLVPMATKETLEGLTLALPCLSPEEVQVTSANSLLNSHTGATWLQKLMASFRGVDGTLREHHYLCPFKSIHTHSNTLPPPHTHSHLFKPTDTHSYSEWLLPNHNFSCPATTYLCAMPNSCLTYSPRAPLNLSCLFIANHIYSLRLHSSCFFSTALWNRGTSLGRALDAIFWDIGTSLLGQKML